MDLGGFNQSEENVHLCPQKERSWGQRSLKF